MFGLVLFVRARSFCSGSFFLFELVLFVRSRSFCLVSFFLFGLVLFVRSCSFCLGSFFLFGLVLFVWVLSFRLGSFFLFGLVLFDWARSFCLGSFFLFGLVHFIRSRSFCLGSFILFGLVLFVRARSFCSGSFFLFGLDSISSSNELSPALRRFTRSSSSDAAPRRNFSKKSSRDASSRGGPEEMAKATLEQSHIATMRLNSSIGLPSSVAMFDYDILPHHLLVIPLGTATRAFGSFGMGILKSIEDKDLPSFKFDYRSSDPSSNGPSEAYKKHLDSFIVGMTEARRAAIEYALGKEPLDQQRIARMSALRSGSHHRAGELFFSSSTLPNYSLQHAMNEALTSAVNKQGAVHLNRSPSAFVENPNVPVPFHPVFTVTNTKDMQRQESNNFLTKYNQAMGYSPSPSAGHGEKPGYANKHRDCYLHSVLLLARHFLRSSVLSTGLLSNAAKQLLNDGDLHSLVPHFSKLVGLPEAGVAQDARVVLRQFLAKVALAKNVSFSAVVNHAERIPTGIKVHLIGALIFTPSPDAIPSLATGMLRFTTSTRSSGRCSPTARRSSASSERRSPTYAHKASASSWFGTTRKSHSWASARRIRHAAPARNRRESINSVSSCALAQAASVRLPVPVPALPSRKFAAPRSRRSSRPRTSSSAPSASKNLRHLLLRNRTRRVLSLPRQRHCTTRSRRPPPAHLRNLSLSARPPAHPPRTPFWRLPLLLLLLLFLFLRRKAPPAPRPILRRWSLRKATPLPLQLFARALRPSFIRRRRTRRPWIRTRLAFRRRNLPR